MGKQIPELHHHKTGVDDEDCSQENIHYQKIMPFGFRHMRRLHFFEPCCENNAEQIQRCNNPGSTFQDDVDIDITETIFNKNSCLFRKDHIRRRQDQNKSDHTRSGNYQRQQDALQQGCFSLMQAPQPLKWNGKILKRDNQALKNPSQKTYGKIVSVIVQKERRIQKHTGNEIGDTPHPVAADKRLAR